MRRRTVAPSGGYLSSAQRLPQVPQAFAGDRVGVRAVVEHLDGNILRVADFGESGEDGAEVRVPEARPASIGVIRMEMREKRPAMPLARVGADRLRGRARLGG